MSERGQTEAARRRVATIFATDVCGYTALSERDPLGAPAAIDRLTERLAGAAARHGGRVFSRAGDGFLLEFPTATAGVAAALEIAEAQRAAPIEAAGEPIRLRTGLHTGEVTVGPSGDLLGHAVNVASRLQGAARPGGILMSVATRGMSAAGAPTRRVGDLKLKNLREPVRAYEVLERGGLSAVLARLDLRGRMGRNRGALTILGGVLTLTVLAFGLWATDRYAEQQAALAAAARQADIDAEAARLADTLLTDEGRLLDRGAVERATAGLLGSDDARKTEAIRLLLANEPVAAAQALKAVHEAQTAASEPEAARLRTALEIGALTADRDQALAQWAYEEAYRAMPQDPYVLRKLATISVSRGELEAGRAYYTALLAINPSPRDQVRALNGLGYVATRERRFDDAEDRHARALAIARANDLAREQAESLRNLGQLASSRVELADGEPTGGEAAYREAVRHYAQASVLARAIGDRPLLASLLSAQGGLAQRRGDLEEAARLYEQRMSLVREFGSNYEVASAALNLAFLAHTQGDAPARERYAAMAEAAAADGSLELMRGYVAGARARFAAEERRVEAACGHLATAMRWADLDDPGTAELLAPAIALDCPS